MIFSTILLTKTVFHLNILVDDLSSFYSELYKISHNEATLVSKTSNE